MEIPTLPSLPKLPTLGVSGSGGAYDADAQAYFDRVAATSSVSNKTNVNNLFVNLKSNGYYTGLTDGWLCRSALNAGTGTTMYAMKSGTNNGTLTNGPSWSADGVRLTVKNHAVATSLSVTFNHAWAVMVIYKDGVDTEANRRVLGSSALAGPTLMYMDASNKAVTHIGSYNGTATYIPPGSFDATAWGLRTLTNNLTAGQIQGYNNTGSLTGFASGGIAAGTHNLQIGTSSGEGTNNPDLTVAAVLYWNATTFSSSDVSSLYTIIKNAIASDILP